MTNPGVGIEESVRLALYRDMVRARYFEQRAYDLFMEGIVKGTTHLGLGQEAVAAGFAAAMKPGDMTFCTYRGHNHTLLRGAPMAPLMAELAGRDIGCCGGKGGSMHLTDVSKGAMGSYAIVGAHLPIAAGAAWAAQVRGTDQVSVCFFGDGTTNIGAFHEAANMACALHLPIVFACENNEYGEFTPRDKTMAITDIVDRAAGYGMPGVICDGMDVVAVYEAAGEAIERARSGGGPALIEAKTYRFYNHHGVQNLGLKYRTDEEVAEKRKQDPIFTFEDRMIEAGTTTRADIDGIWEELRADIESAIQFAEDSPLPDPEAVLADVYSPREEVPA